MGIGGRKEDEEDEDEDEGTTSMTKEGERTSSRSRRMTRSAERRSKEERGGGAGGRIKRSLSSRSALPRAKRRYSMYHDVISAYHLICVCTHLHHPHQHHFDNFPFKLL